MFGLGIKSGRNDVVYNEDTKLNEKKTDEIQDYEKEKERLEFKWRVIKHTEKSIEFKLQLKNEEVISFNKVDKLIFSVKDTKFLISS